MFNRRIDLLAATVVLTASMHSRMTDVPHVNPEPWRKDECYHGGKSSTGKSGHDIARSRAKEKHARRARKMNRRT